MWNKAVLQEESQVWNEDGQICVDRAWLLCGFLLGLGGKGIQPMTRASVFVAVPAKRESVMQVWTETRGLASATEAGIWGSPGARRRQRSAAVKGLRERSARVRRGRGEGGSFVSRVGLEASSQVPAGAMKGTPRHWICLWKGCVHLDGRGATWGSEAPYSPPLPRLLRTGESGEATSALGRKAGTQGPRPGRGEEP